MRLAVKRLRIDDVGKLQALVVENFDAIEPGLTVLDARLLLGHATIDVIGVDTAGALVLGAVGFTANEEMLLKAVEAYSWCLEYPESLVRLYPSCRISEERPPRLLFVVERVPDAFHRKIKQLGFPEVDCVEFRHLEIDGTATVYFETLLRLRRGGAPAAVHVALPETPPSAPPTDPSGENVIAMGTTPARAMTVRVQKLISPGGAEAPTGGPRASERPAPAPVVSMVSRQSAVTARVERPRPALEPLVLREPEPLIPEPAAVELAPVASVAEPASTATIPPLDTAAPDVAVALETEQVTLRGLPELSLRPATPSEQPVIAPLPRATAESAEARVSFKDLAATLLGGASPSPVPAAPAVEAPIAVEEPVVATPLIEIAPAFEPVIVAPVDLASAPIRVATVGPHIEEIATPPATALLVEPVEATVACEPVSTLTVEALVASTAPAAAPVSQQVAAETAKQLLTALPQEFAGLNFPNDGVLTRQWMEFLNQMSGTK
jgi:hypothetical protein